MHTSYEMDKPGGSAGQKTAPEDLEIIRKMAVRYGDEDIARVLNKLRRRTGKGMPWSTLAVKTARRKYDIAGQAKTTWDGDVLCLNGAARYLGVSDTTITKLAKAGVLQFEQMAPYAPWEIQRSVLDSEPVQRVVAELKKTGHLRLQGEPPGRQRNLFE